MSRVSTYKQIMREYEKDRDQSRAVIATRKEELYEKIPRLHEIDYELKKIAINISKSVLSGMEASVQINRLKHESAALQSEKKSILEINKYPPDYLTPVYKCNLCSDTGYTENKKCRCLRQRLINRYYEQSNIMDIIQRENFDTFDFRLYSDKTDTDYGISPLLNIQTVCQKCMDFISDFNKDYSNLLFYGNTGLGKTFLCNCIAKDLLDMGKTVLYVTAPRIFKKIEDFRFNRDEQENPSEQLELIYDVDLLIIDDLGSEFSTVITNTELFNIINSRMLERKPVIISTNLSISELKNTYTDRMASRIYGNYIMLRLFGDDIRLKKKISGK